MSRNPIKLAMLVLALVLLCAGVGYVIAVKAQALKNGDRSTLFTSAANTNTYTLSAEASTKLYDLQVDIAIQKKIIESAQAQIQADQSMQNSVLADAGVPPADRTRQWIRGPNGVITFPPPDSKK